jgi:hypothetical protein
MAGPPQFGVAPSCIFSAAAACGPCGDERTGTWSFLPVPGVATARPPGRRAGPPAPRPGPDAETRAPARRAKVSGSRVRDRRDQSPGAAEPVIRGLSKEHAEAWRRRRVPYLEQVTEASLGKPSSALRILQSWAQSEGLQPRETIYVS